MNATSEKGQPNQTRCRLVLIAGLLIWFHFAWITFLSSQFHFEIPNRDRPIVLVTSLLISASLVALAALLIALRIKKPSKDFLRFVFLFAIAFRLIQLFSPAIQEIDSYRYVWDGIVVSNGHSPYRYSPHQVLHGPLSNVQGGASELSDLHELALSTPSRATIVSRIDHSDVRTIYPPVSQAVFGMTMFLIPESAGVMTCLVAMKVTITCFDIATLLLLIHLLSLLKLHPLWSMVYGWNPLVIKEFSNSGHLDSIAVFFVIASLVAMIHAVQKWAKVPKADARPQGRSTTWLVASAVLLAAGFAAKIYPIILAPFLTVYLLSSGGWKKAGVFALVFTIGSVIFFYPMIAGSMISAPTTSASQNAEEGTSANSVEDREGLSTFLRYWQMNELAYMLVYQNLKDVDPDQTSDRPWFRIENESIRLALLQPAILFVDPADAPYVMSRMMTLGLFAIFYAYLIGSCLRKPWTKRDLLSSCFWIIAIFFCLQPTQNPWYWTWALPFLPFCKNRGWLLYSPLLLIYYYRFWFIQLPGPYRVLGESYSGRGLFDFVVVWFEHLPVWLAIVGVSIWQLAKNRGQAASKIVNEGE